MTFHPNQKAATIYMTKNDDEPDHKNKLSLTEIYNALAKRKGTEPGEMRVVTFEVELADKETNGLISGIRKDRNLGPFEEIKILPGADEWDMIATTQYYAKLLQVVNRPIQKIVIRNRDHFGWLSEVTHINRVSFSLAPPENKAPVPGTATEVSAAEVQAEFDDEEQEAALEALFATDEESRDLFQAEIGRKCASRISGVDSDV
ncbi:hypothetical protein CFO_g3243 [Ceratocystis platani]|uniref:Uncharacterized protein n=1 Tax=Ceratocystis fimbriata f. sp. platani TaxID=88771 RepID=A0A0F8CUL3_CERFI|nr:hypothetical protein CFO_g3243 [Ceratocystis platani]